MNSSIEQNPEISHGHAENINEGELQAVGVTVSVSPALYMAEKIGKLFGTTDTLKDENSKLHQEIKALTKENDTLKQKIESLEGKNKKLKEKISATKSSQEKLQKEHESIKKANDQLRIEIKEESSKFSRKNAVLEENLEELKSEFRAVENENKELKCRLKDLTTKNDFLESSVKLISDKNQLIQKENQQLKDDMADLKLECRKISERLECKEAKLALGHVPWMLERGISKYIVPDVNLGMVGILDKMEKWLKKNSSSDDGKAAEKKWNELKVKLNWNEDQKDHKGALKCLRKLRLSVAHPQNVDLEEARKQLKDGNYVADMDKESCEDIINMVITVGQLNNSN